MKALFERGECVREPKKKDVLQTVFGAISKATPGVKSRQCLRSGFGHERRKVKLTSLQSQRGEDLNASGYDLVRGPSNAHQSSYRTGGRAHQAHRSRDRRSGRDRQM